jgi:hypothetical protein
MLAQGLDYRLDNNGFKSWEGQEIFLSSKSCRVALGTTQFHFYWVPWIIPRLKVAGHDVDHSLHLVPSLRMSGAILPLPHIPSWHGQGQLHLYFIHYFILKGWMKLFVTSCIWQLYRCTTRVLFDEIFWFSNLECIQFFPILLEHDKSLITGLTHKINLFLIPGMSSINSFSGAHVTQ